MFSRSLKVLSRNGVLRLAAEMSFLFISVTVLYVVVLEPSLNAFFPGTFAETGLDYSRTDPPDTASEITHLLISVMTAGSFFYWRFRHTELGKELREDLKNGRYGQKGKK